MEWAKLRDSDKKLLGYTWGPYDILKLRHSFALFRRGIFINDFDVLADARAVAEHQENPWER